MILTSGEFMSCPNQHGKLHPLWDVSDLPAARRYDYKRFTIDATDGYWEYVPHAHKGCMDRVPEAGTIVAKISRVWGRNLWSQAMVFRPVKSPKAAK